MPFILRVYESFFNFWPVFNHTTHNQWEKACIDTDAKIAVIRLQRAKEYSCLTNAKLKPKH